MSYITIEGFEKLSAQQLFDMALSHIRSTREQAMDDYGSCTYAGSGCAASQFLKPKERIARNKAWPELVNRGRAPAHQYNLVCAIQDSHDSYCGPTEWLDFMTYFEARMQEVAEDYGLTYIPEKR